MPAKYVTPTVGMLGLVEDVARVVRTGFTLGTVVLVLGEPPAALGSSEYTPQDARFPRFALASERRLTELLRVLATRRLLVSAQDVSDGGLAVALAECALLGECGATLRLQAADMEVALFSEDQARAVITCSPQAVGAVVTLATQHGVAAMVAGRPTTSRRSPTSRYWQW